MLNEVNIIEIDDDIIEACPLVQWARKLDYLLQGTGMSGSTFVDLYSHPEHIAPTLREEGNSEEDIIRFTGFINKLRRQNGLH